MPTYVLDLGSFSTIQRSKYARDSFQSVHDNNASTCVQWVTFPAFELFWHEEKHQTKGYQFHREHSSKCIRFSRVTRREFLTRALIKVTDHLF